MVRKTRAPSFFKETKYTPDIDYRNMEHSIRTLVNDDVQIEPSSVEINFVFRLIGKLRIDFEHGPLITKEVLEEMLKGGHIKFGDGGLFYDELIKAFNSNIEKRHSSHKSCVQQYSFSGPLLKEVLFGVSEDKNGNKKTWIQFEKHNTKTLINLILHMLDYIVHKWTGKNIGPYGSSDYTEHNPIVVGPT